MSCGLPPALEACTEFTIGTGNVIHTVAESSMQKKLYRIVATAAGVILASGCSSDSPAGPSEFSGSSVVVSSDIAATSGNAIASDVEALIANEAASVGSFARLAPVSSASFDGDAPLPSPAPAPSTPEQPNCTAAPQPGVFFCQKEPGAGDHLKCTYSEEKKLFVCVKQEEPAASPPSGEPKPAPQPAPGGEQPAPPQPQAESCSFDAAALIHSCTKSEEGKTVVKSYQFLDAARNPMPAFIRGTTDAIHFLVKTDANEVRDNYRSVTHSLRDQTESGFLGPNRVWNGFGASADSNAHVEGVSNRRYTGSAVDTLKAVTFVDERSSHPYPLSGQYVRVVDYSVVSGGDQPEISVVHKRVVVTFNGTAEVPIAVGDYRCVLNLDTHKVDGCK